MKRSRMMALVALLSLAWVACTPPVGSGRPESKAGTSPVAANPDKNVNADDDKEDRTPDVVFVPTPHEVVARMLELADVKKGEIVYDLGCGDGRIVVAAAKKGAKATGYDIDPQRIKESKETVEKNEEDIKKAEGTANIEKKDIFTLDLSKANVITLYLLPTLNVKLIPQLEKLKPGSRIVSHDFDMKGVKPEKVETVKLPDGREKTVYLWITPLKKEE